MRAPAIAPCRIYTVFETLTVVAFMLAIELPLLGFVFGWYGGPFVENRRPAKAPTLEGFLDPGTDFPEQFERHFADHFGFRQLLVRWDRIVRVLWLGLPVPVDGTRGAIHRVSSTIKGTDSWFFLFASGMLEDFRGVAPLPSDRLLALGDIFAARHASLAELGIHYLLVVVPEKQSVYPENVPSRFERRSDETRARQLAAQLEHRGVPVVDLQDALVEAKSRYPTYHRTGTHWNDFGAWVAYDSILRALEPNFPGMRARPLDAFAIDRRLAAARALVTITGLGALVREDLVTIHPKVLPLARIVEPPWLRRQALFELQTARRRLVTEHPDASLPRAIVYHDSFMQERLDVLLAEHFSRADFRFRLRPDGALIQRERPDVVIEEHVERAFALAPEMLGP